MAKAQKQTKVDQPIGSALATYAKVRGVRQQHVLSAATFFYMTCPDEVRSAIDAAYAKWSDETIAKLPEDTPVDIVEAFHQEHGPQPPGPCVWDGSMSDGQWPPRSFALTFTDGGTRKRQLHEAVRDALADAIQRTTPKPRPTKRKRR